MPQILVKIRFCIKINKNEKVKINLIIINLIEY